MTWTTGLLLISRKPSRCPGASPYTNLVDQLVAGRVILVDEMAGRVVGTIIAALIVNAASWAEARGFGTTVIESRFLDGTKRSSDEPSLAIVGVDNLAARRAAAGWNFDLVVDAGLRATPSEIFDVRLHGFPGGRSPEQTWPQQDGHLEVPLVPALQEFVDAGRIDRCGALTIAGRSLGVPSTAVAAAAIQVAQACRAVSDGTFVDLADVALTNCRRAAGRRHMLARPGILPFVRTRLGAAIG